MEHTESVCMRMVANLLLFTLTFFAFAETSTAPSTDLEPYRKTSTEKHEMRVINSGIASLYARVDMIRRAKKSIDLESFIFNTDLAGKVILKELAEAVKRGVKVRVLVDKAPGVAKIDRHVAQAMREHGIEVRYYNDTSIFRLSKMQFRNHRKLMVRDGEEAITGGRNIADEYFDLSRDFNFHDRDVTVEGEIVKSMSQTFENYWNSKIVEEPKKPVPPNPHHFNSDGNSDYEDKLRDFERDQKRARALFDPHEEVEKILQLLETEGKESFLEYEKRICPEIAFASDREGAGFWESLSREKYYEKYRHVQQEIMKWMDTKIKDELIVDTPYFLRNNITEKIMQYLQSKRARVKLFTNSLASTDAIHVSAVFNDSVTFFTPYEDFDAYVYRGKYSGERKLYSDEVRDATWGTHSKSMVFSDDSFMIGSFNIDNRSSYYNNELAVFCSGSPELTADVKNNIQKRMENSFRLNSNDFGDDDCDPHAEVGALKKLMYYLVKIPSHLFQHLL